MTVYFANAGLIDLDVIRIMGVSVKSKDSPIGYFGTGLKFAIATLLRTGHEIILQRGGEIFTFSTRKQNIRGEDFDAVYMNEERLPFTTELGKNWEVWQAYREIHSNTLDEDGRISDQPISGDTIIKVSGAAFEREYKGRDRIFVSGKPVAANDFIEVYEGGGRSVFYRGVRAGDLPGDLLYRYNILHDMVLTEDRTFQSTFDVEWKLAQHIPRLDHKGVISDLLDGTKCWDQNLDFSYCSSPSREFLEVAATRYSDTTSSHAAKKLVERDMQNRAEYTPAKLLDQDHEKFLSAFPILCEMGCSLSPEDVEIVESLGPNHMAIFHKKKNQIFLAKSTLDWGIETVVATLFEEWLHKEYHYKDQSRELQNYLFQRLVSVTMGTTPPQPEKQS